MEQNKLVPKRRFEGFEEEWDEHELGEVAESFEYGLNASAINFDGENKYIRITDIDDNTRLFKQNDLTSPKTDLSTAEDYLLQKGDILFARTGASVGKTYRYQNHDGKVYYAGFLIRARVKSGYDAEFIFQNTLTKKYENYIKITSQRSGQPGVNAEEYASYKLMIPNLKEQQKIGEFFKHLDKTIALQQKKIDKTKALKSAYLAEMFPAEVESVPKRRFDGFTDEWEKNKLEEVAVYRRGSFPQPYGKEEWYDAVDGMPFVQVVDVGENLQLVDKTKQRISKLAQPHSVFVEEGKVLVTLQGSIGRVAITQYPSYVDRTILIFESFKENIDKNYFAYIIQTLFEKEKVKAPGGTIKTITIEALSAFEILLPNIKEQEKIGDFFNNLDNMIANHQQRLEKLKATKQAYLNEMFV